MKGAFIAPLCLVILYIPTTHERKYQINVREYRKGNQLTLLLYCPHERIWIYMNIQHYTMRGMFIVSLCLVILYIPTTDERKY